MDSMNPKEIKTHPFFADLFPIKEDVLSKIEEHIRENQFLISHPLDLAIWNGQKEPVCIDGHTRLQAALNLGLETVPVITHELDSEDEALELAIHLQRNRRNMTDAEIMSCIQAVDARRRRGGDRRSEEAKSKPQGCGIEESRSASAKKTAEIIGVSTRKVEQVRTITDHGEEDILESVKNGEISINRAYQETQKKRKAAEAADNEGESDSPNPANKSTEAPTAARDSDEEGTVRSADHGTAEMDGMTIRLKPDQYRALEDLGDSIEHHVELAIDVYLRMVADEFAYNDEDGTEINPEDCQPDLH